MTDIKELPNDILNMVPLQIYEHKVIKSDNKIYIREDGVCKSIDYTIHKCMIENKWSIVYGNNIYDLGLALIISFKLNKLPIDNYKDLTIVFLNGDIQYLHTTNIVLLEDYSGDYENAITQDGIKPHKLI